MLKQDLYNTPEEKVKYEHDMTTERDRRNQLAFSYDKGVEEGRKQGIEKGIEEGIKKGRVEGREEGRNQEREDVQSVCPVILSEAKDLLVEHLASLRLFRGTPEAE